jgi:hypothetical protein
MFEKHILFCLYDENCPFLRLKQGFIPMHIKVDENSVRKFSFASEFCNSLNLLNIGYFAVFDPIACCQICTYSISLWKVETAQF